MGSLDVGCMKACFTYTCIDTEACAYDMDANICINIDISSLRITVCACVHVYMYILQYICTVLQSVNYKACFEAGV